MLRSPRVKTPWQRSAIDRFGIALLLSLCFGCAALEAPAPDPAPPGHKSFLNLTVPGETSFTPIVIEATPQHVLIARVSDDAGSAYGRDIQVMEMRGGALSFVGDRGQALLAQRNVYPFLLDARRAPDGTLWVLGALNRQEHGQILGTSYRLFRLEQGQAWVQAARVLELDRTAHWAFPLHFTAEGQPVVIFGVPGPSQTVYAVTPIADGWKASALQPVLRTHADWVVPPVSVSGAGRLWIAWRSADRSGARLMSVNLASPHEVGGPWIIDDHGGWPQSMAVSPAGRIMVTFAQSPPTYKPMAAIIDVEPDAAQPRVQVVPMPDGTSALMSSVAWSPAGEPCLACNVSTQQLRVWWLDGERWRELASITQPAGRGQLFSPRLSFNGEGQPIVVWEDFFPCGGVS